MRFRRVVNGTFEISPAALDALLSHRQVGSRQNESGGVLLGRLIKGSSDIVVDAVTKPTRVDKQSRFRFFRSAEPAQAAVNAAWAASGGTKIYLGEWHTHPEDVPRPSGVDLRDWRRVAKQARFEQDALFFTIVGRTTVAVWELRRGERSPTLLNEGT